MISMTKLINWANIPTKTLDWISPLGDLFVRLYLANIFLKSAWVKIQSWETTLFLFKYEYKVPFIPSDVAAYFGTGAEFVLPILVLLGLGTRLPIIGFFLFNLTAVFSYPFLLTEAGACALNAHIFWGFLLGYLMLHGYGKLSLDYLISKIWKSAKDLRV